MGEDVSGLTQTAAQTRAFTKALLRDVQALERMLAEGMFEMGVRRIGVEQEMFLVNRGSRPASMALVILDELDGPFTTELALYNLEANVEPRLLGGRCFADLHARLSELLTEVRAAAKRFDTDVVLTGILPTLTKSDVTLENITPKPRYRRSTPPSRRLGVATPTNCESRGATSCTPSTPPSCSSRATPASRSISRSIPTSSRVSTTSLRS